MLMVHRSGAAVGVLVLLVACRAGSVRPFYQPVGQAFADTIRTTPDALVLEVARLVVAEGFTIHALSPDEGYLETEWHDVAADSAGRDWASASSRVIRLRFFTDVVDEHGSRVAAEAVYRRTLDPSLPPRLAEVMVPDGHPGEMAVRRILAALAERFGRR